MKRFFKSYFLSFTTDSQVYLNLLSNSTVIFLSSILVNGFNFMFHFVAIRSLSIADYGILQTMINLFNIATVLTVFINTQLTRQLTKYVAKGKVSFASALVNKSNLFAVIFGVIIITVFIFVNSFTKIEIGLVNSQNLTIVIILSMLAYVLTINRALMRAHLQFFAFAINTNFNVVSKLIITVVLLFLGFKLTGVILSLIISGVLAILYSTWQLRGKLFFNLFEKINFNVKNFTKESALTMVGVLGLTSLISTDLILTQYYLPSQAGFYAGLTLFGKAIILITLPLSTVLFPSIISAKNNIIGKKLFKFAIFGVFILSLSIFFVYLLIPKQMVALILSSSYQNIAPLLPLYTLSIFFYSLSNIIVYGFIALEEFSPGYAALLATISQIIGIFFFHETLQTIVNVSLFINIGLLVYLTLFTKLRVHKITKRYYANNQYLLKKDLFNTS